MKILSGESHIVNDDPSWDLQRLIADKYSAVGNSPAYEYQLRTTSAEYAFFALRTQSACEIGKSWLSIHLLNRFNGFRLD